MRWSKRGSSDSRNNTLGLAFWTMTGKKLQKQGFEKKKKKGNEEERVADHCEPLSVLVDKSFLQLVVWRDSDEPWV